MADAPKDAFRDNPAGPPVKPGAAQHDELQELRNLWDSYGTSIIVALTVAAVAIAGGLMYRNHARSSLEEASNALTSARNAQDLENLVSRNASTPVAPLAMMKLAKAYFEAGNYDLALAKYAEFAAKFPDHSMAMVAEMGKVNCQEAKNQTEDALKGFREFAQKNPKHFLTPQAVLGEGRCLEALGKADEARTLYEDFITANPESGWKARAEELLEAINKKSSKSATPTSAIQEEAVPAK